jgi:hypothetical protein
MSRSVRTFLFNWFLGVPGSLVQLTGWLLLVCSMREITLKGTNLGFPWVAVAPLSLLVFLTGRLMDLACDFLTGALRMPENKKPWVISLIYPLGVQIMLAGVASQFIAFPPLLLGEDRAGMVRCGAVSVIFIAAAITTQVYGDRFRKRVRREWEEQWQGTRDHDTSAPADADPED